MSRSLPRGATADLLALVLALALFRLGTTPLVGPDEPRYGRAAVEMQRAGDWVRPTLQGEPWLEKTPLYYWLAGAAFSVLGETEAAARAPSVLAALVLVVVGWFWGLLTNIGLLGAIGDKFGKKAAYIDIASLLCGYCLSAGLSWGYVD